ncbi:MAG: hypothetical protein QW343_03575 [Candidatus Norongarragalinales archaeon]
MVSLKIVFDKRKALFLAGFTIIGLAAYQLKFSTILGVPSQSFSFFQFLGPIGSQLFSVSLGVASVLLVEVANFALSGKALDAITLARFFPMAFAAVYFGTQFRGKQHSKNRLILAVPIACMFLFFLHPEGRAAWFYSLYWLIPVIAAAWFEKSLIARALGATFTAHAVGATAFLWAFNIPASTWAALVPITAFERSVFALGIAASVVVFSTVLDAAEHKAKMRIPVRYEARYSLLRVENF